MKSCLALTIFTVALAMTPPCFAGTARSDIATGIDFIRSFEKLPPVEDFDREIPVSNEPPSEMALRIFRRLMAVVNGNEKDFALATFLGLGAHCDVKKRIIYVDPKFERTLMKVTPENERETVFASILAHEIGHYFHEAHIQHSKGKRSPLGMRSYIYSDGLSNREWYLIHGEVDAIGLEIMRRAGYDVSRAAQFLEYSEVALTEMIPDSYHGVMPDKKERLEIIGLYLSGK